MRHWEVASRRNNGNVLRRTLCLEAHAILCRNRNIKVCVICNGDPIDRTIPVYILVSPVSIMSIEWFCIDGYSFSAEMWRTPSGYGSQERAADGTQVCGAVSEANVI